GGSARRAAHRAPARASPPSADAGQPGAVEEAVRPVERAQPGDAGVDVGDQRLDVDAVRGGPVVFERDHRLCQEMHRATRRAPARAQVEARRKLHERLEEGPVGGWRLAPALLPHLLGFEVAAAVEEPHAAADGGGDVGRDVEAAGRGHLRSTRGTAASISRAKCSAGRAAERWRSMFQYHCVYVESGRSIRASSRATSWPTSHSYCSAASRRTASQRATASAWNSLRGAPPRPCRLLAACAWKASGSGL